MNPYSISCTTCQARLKVRSPEVIGQILGCPKCGSMVQITPPPGWQPDSDLSPQAADSSPSMEITDSAQSSQQPANQQATSTTPAKASPSVSGDPSPQISSPAKADTQPQDSEGTLDSQSTPGDLQATEPVQSQPIETPPLTSTATDSLPLDAVEPPPLIDPVEVPESVPEPTPLPPQQWTAPAEQLSRRLLLPSLIGGTLLFMVLLAVGFWTSRQTTSEEIAADEPAAADPSDPRPSEIENSDKSQDNLVLPPPPEQPIDAPAQPTRSVSSPGDPARGESIAEQEKPGGAVLTPSPENEKENPSLVASGPTESPSTATNPTAPDTKEQPSLSTNIPPTTTGNSELASLGKPESNEFLDVLEQPKEPVLNQDLIEEQPGTEENPAPPAPPLSSVVQHVEDAPQPEPALKIDTQLAQQIDSLHLPNTSLLKFADLVTQLSGITVSLDTESLAAYAPPAEIKLSVQSEQATLADTLSKALAPAKLTYRTEAGQIQITAKQADSPPQKLALPMEDLITDSPGSRDALRTMIETLIAPTTWNSQGGTGTATWQDTKLEVVQVRDTMFEVIVLCEKLRKARGLPRRSRLAERHFPLESRSSQAAQWLNRQTLFTFHKPTRLSTWVRQVGKMHDLTILIDWPSLAQLDYSQYTQITCSIQDTSLGESLTAVLEPLGLDFRLVGKDVIEIYGRPDTEAKQQLEFFDCQQLIASDVDKNQIQTAILSALSASERKQSVLFFDAPSKFFLVRGSRTVLEKAESTIDQLAK